MEMEPEYMKKILFSAILNDWYNQTYIQGFEFK